MAESALLETLAEVAVVLVGFASLVSIFGQRSSFDHALTLGARMRAMVLTSLLVTGFALLPLLVSSYGASPGTTWSICAAALLVAVAGYVAWFVTAVRTLRRGTPGTRLQKRVIMPVLILSFIALGVLLIVNIVVGSPALYLTALSLLLFQGGFAFSLIVFSFLPHRTEEDRPGGTGSAEGS
jgi:hypothetical protein